MLTYFFVFGVVLTRVRHDPSRTGFALYFLAGMLPWLAFSEAAGRAPVVMLEHRNFVKKLVFAVETLPVNLVVAGLVTEMFGAAVCSRGLLILRADPFPLRVLWLPAADHPADSVHRGPVLVSRGARRLRARPGQIMVLLTLWFFLTPICYPETRCPRQLRISSPRTRSTSWCADIAPFSWKTTRRHSGRCGSCGCLGVVFVPGTRVVLQIAEIVRGHDLIRPKTCCRAVLTRA